MARKLTPELYAFRWLAEEMAKREITINAAAEKVGRTRSTVINWMSGVYLSDAVTKPGTKDDVAVLIADLLDCDVDEVRHQISIFLISKGVLPSDNANKNFRSEVASFVKTVKDIYYYDSTAVLTPEKRELINAVLSVLEKI